MVCFAIVTDAWYVYYKPALTLSWDVMWPDGRCEYWQQGLGLIQRTWFDLASNTAKLLSVSVFSEEVFFSCGQSLAKEFIWLESPKGWCSTETLVQPAFWCIGILQDKKFNSSIRFNTSQILSKVRRVESCSLQSFGVWDCFPTLSQRLAL